MAVLDCETYGSTIESISQVYGVGVDSIEGFLKVIDLEAEYERSKIYHSCDTYLKILFEQEFGAPRVQLDTVAWFHLTRTVSASDFSQGILPLGQVLGRIWDMLDSLLDDPVQKANLAAMRVGGVDDFQYNLKSQDKFHHGPYAMLVREAAFNSGRIGNHDYLEVPEIIEDICSGYKKQFGHCIYRVIVSKLKKCIVKFESGKLVDDSLLAPALLYCWCKVRGEEFSSFANTCFDSEGVAIPKEKIVGVSFL
ncbi:hypothetical protein WP8S17C03_34020 [Metapseudomonas otitidis]|uniref:Uncharacterized protein n=1 Tax=Metapseudomonas otitidis TaxID=319939 RepID=A0A6S5RQW2_9GAMM|nr:hypothetical protein [Pseudomonas otitidis]BBT17353.1 hypothetical protein WP8S17C03_34020 [Pseudomonas otitidis]